MPVLQHLSDAFFGGRTNDSAPAPDRVEPLASNGALQEQLPARASEKSVYIARRGDTLGSIAKRATGDWKQFHALNVFNNRRFDDDSLEEGQALVLPPAWDPTTLGLAPRVSETPTLDSASVATEGDASSWGVETLSWLASAATEGYQSVEGASRVTARVVEEALSEGYARFFRRGGAAEPAQDEAREASEGIAQAVEEPQVAEPAARAFDDGFDEAAARRHVDEIIDGYMRIDVGGVEVRASYRNTSSNAFRDPVWQRYDEVQLRAKSEAVWYAARGKASPQQLQEALQIAVREGAIHRDLGKPREETLTAEEIEGWADTRLGVDCIGLVMNALLDSEDYGDFEPPVSKQERWRQVMGTNCRDFEGASDEITEPDQWRALDVVTWTNVSGHVLLIRSVTRRDDGRYALDCLESKGGSSSRGAVRGTYTFEPDTGRFAGLSLPKGAKPTVRRPRMPQDKDAAVDAA